MKYIFTFSIDLFFFSEDFEKARRIISNINNQIAISPLFDHSFGFRLNLRHAVKKLKKENLSLLRLLYQNDAIINAMSKNGGTHKFLPTLNVYQAVMKYLNKEWARFKIKEQKNVESPTSHHSRIL